MSDNLMNVEDIRADHRVTMEQITMGVLMSCGARDFVYDDERGLLYFRVGKGGMTVTKIIVRLMPTDTYAVQRGHFSMDYRRDDFGVWYSDETRTDVYDR